MKALALMNGSILLLKVWAAYHGNELKKKKVMRPDLASPQMPVKMFYAPLWPLISAVNADPESWQ